jgi:predicted short-subunit dehydrogenase-like oxidoreductase (DUF2520 family)
MATLNLIGAGRVGQTLAHLWQQHGDFSVQDVLTRSPDSAAAACTFIGSGRAVTDLSAMRAADVWMLAVPDAVVPAVAAQLAATAKPVATAFHCSGALGASELAALQANGWHCASAHCILSFTSAHSASQQFPGTPCALEGDAPALAQLQSAFSAIGARCFEVAAQNKLLYHAGAVFATNFLPVLQATAEAAWSASGVPAELLPELRQALLRNAVANITRLGPAAALTGPAARGDLPAVARQAAAVSQWDAASGAAYRALSDLALRLANTSKASDASAASTHWAGSFSSKSI